MSTIDKILNLDDDTKDTLNRILFGQGIVMRKHDMSPDGELTACIQDDGDACLAIYDDENKRVASMEFTTPGAGGGQSENTWFAMRLLFLAIVIDEVERPGHRSGGYPVDESVKALIEKIKELTK